MMRNETGNRNLGRGVRRRSAWHLLLGWLMLAGLLAGLAGCAAGAAPQQPETPPALQPAAGMLPSPAELRLPSSAFNQRSQSGLDWQADLPHNLVSATESAALFEPQGPQPAGLAGVAYATYVFTIGHPTGAPLHFDLGWPEAPGGDSYYIALANWRANRWDWSVAYAPFRYMRDSIAPYLKPLNEVQDQLVVLVAVAGSQPASLQQVILGAFYDSQPVPEVSWDEGALPDEILFDASASYNPDGTIEEFLWDFNEDGAFEATGPTAQYVFPPAAQTRPVLLRVVDSEGESAEETFWVQPLHWSHELLPWSLDSSLPRAIMDEYGRLHLVGFGMDHATVQHYVFDGVNSYLEPVHFHPAALTASQIELAFNPGGELCLAYIARGVEAEGPPSQVYFARLVDGVWQHELVDEPAAGFVGLSSLAMVLDSAGEPLLAYASQSAPGAGCVNLARHTPAGWVITPAIGTGWEAECVGLALNSAGNPCLAASMDMAGYDVVYATFDGSGWNVSTTIGPAYTDVQALGLTANDKPIALVGLTTGAPHNWGMMLVTSLGSGLTWYNGGGISERSLITRGPGSGLSVLCGRELLTLTGITTPPKREYESFSMHGGAAVGVGYDADGKPWVAVRRPDGSYVVCRRAD